MLYELESAASFRVLFLHLFALPVSFIGLWAYREWTHSPRVSLPCFL